MIGKGDLSDQKGGEISSSLRVVSIISMIGAASRAGVIWDEHSRTNRILNTSADQDAAVCFQTPNQLSQTMLLRKLERPHCNFHTESN